MLPLQLGGSLSCGPVSTAGHMLCTALQTTQRFINTAQIRLFMHRGEAEIARSPQPCNALGSRILPISPAKAGKASQPSGCLGPFASRALGIHPFAPGGDRTVYHITISTALPEAFPLGSSQHSQPHAALAALWDQRRTPNPAAPTPYHRSNPAPSSDRRHLSPRQPLAGHTPASSSSHLATFCFRQRNRRKAAVTPHPRAAASRSGPYPRPPPRGTPRTGSAQPPPDPRAVPPRSPPAASRCCAAAARSSSGTTSDAAHSRSAGGGAMAAPAHGGGGAAAAFLEPSRRGGTDGGVPGAAPSRSAPGRGALLDSHAWPRRGEARPRCRRPSPRRRSERGPATRGRRRSGLVSARGEAAFGGFFTELVGCDGTERCVPASPGSPQRPRFGCRVAGLEHHLPRL